MKNFSAKLDRFAAKMKSLQIAPAIQEETIAIDYPNDWQKIQRLLHIQAWSITCALIFCCFLIAGKRMYFYPISHFASFFHFLLVSGFIISCVFMIYSSTYRCPRCKKHFIPPNSKAASSILKNPDSRCENCGLKIGKLTK